MSLELSGGNYESQELEAPSVEEYSSVGDQRLSLDMPADAEEVPRNADTFNKQVTVTEGLEYKSTKDRYVGDVDPVTKLREGNGCYTYTNRFFQY